MTTGAHGRRRAAVLDGLAVLVGILIAFGIDAAWDERQERDEAEAALVSLEVELEENRADIGLDLEEKDTALAVMARYIVAVSRPVSGPVSQDSIRAMVWHMGPPNVEPVQRAAFDDLVSGRLQRVEDAEIRRLVLRYGQAIEPDAVMQRDLKQWFDSRSAYDETLGDLVGMKSTMDGGWAGRTDVGFRIDPATFFGSRLYANYLASRFYRFEHLRDTRAELLDRLEELQASLRARQR